MNAFWVTNISKKDISIGDLGILIKARSRVNLLSRFYKIPMEKLLKSKESGSLSKRKKELLIGFVAPEEEKKQIEVSSQPLYSEGLRSNYVIEEEVFEELDVPDESFADDMTIFSDI